MGYSGQRYSPLTQITKENVSKLVPVWGYSLADLQGGEAFPLVKDGVIYVTTHDATAAVDAHDRQADLEGQARVSAGDPARRLLRHRQSRRRDL